MLPMNTTQFDVAVIGAGIVGASCAYHLAQRGLKVVVLEAFASHAEGSTCPLRRSAGSGLTI